MGYQGLEAAPALQMAAPGEKKSVETKESSEDGDEMVQFRLMGDPILRERAPEVTFDVHDDGSESPLCNYASLMAVLWDYIAA